MPCFTDIPSELLCDVFSHLGQKDLANLCFVCRRLRLVAEPFLYRQVSLNTIRIPVFESFEQSIRFRPELLTYVKSLTLRWGHSPPTYWYSRHELDTPAPIDAWIFGVVMSMFGVRSVYHVEWHHFIPLLRLLPRLEVLDLWPSGDLNILDIPLRYGDLPRFECLREVRCNWENSSKAVCSATLIFLLTLPSLRTLEVRLPHRIHYSASFPGNFIGTSGVTDLRLSYGCMSAVEFETVLRIPRALTHFSYNNFPSTLMNIQKLGWLLQRVCRATLQVLALTMRPSYITFLGYYRLNFPIQSLRDWPVLRSVRSSLTVLLGPGPAQSVVHLIDVLPVVIRELEIELDTCWTETEIAAEVIELLHWKGLGEVDQLVLLTIPVQVHEAARWLSVACDVAGVKLVLTREWKL